MIREKITISMLIVCLMVTALSGCGKTSNEQPKQNKETASAQEQEINVSANDNGMKVVLENPYSGETPSYEVSYSQMNHGYVGIISFKIDGHNYEMCLTGLPEELTESQIKDMIGGFLDGNPVTIEGDKLIDAEKTSNKMSTDTGNWIVNDGERSGFEWGDSSQCWAASTSDMLWSTGWAEVGMQENNELKFAGEDDVFTYFCNYFMNRGGYQSGGIQWFFTGMFDEEMYTMKDSTGNISEYNPKDFYETGSFDTYDDNPIGIGEFVKRLSVLKDGGAVGINIDFNSITYTAKADENTIISYNNGLEEYTSFELMEIDPDDTNLIEALYSLDNRGRVIKLDKNGDDYVDEKGNKYDKLNVLEGYLYRFEDGSYSVVNSENESFICDYNKVWNEDDIDFSNPDESILIGNGAHAVTVSGYVIDTSATNEDEQLKALFITDSDNDAAFYSLNDDNRDKAKRRNSIILYNTTVKQTEYENKTIILNGYFKDNNVAIANMTTLKRAPR